LIEVPVGELPSPWEFINSIEHRLIMRKKRRG